MESLFGNWRICVILLFLFCWSPNQLMADLPTAQYRIRYAITENQPEDLRIGKLDEDLLQTPEIRQSELFNLLQTSKLSMIRYQIREASQYFRLNEQTSVLSTTTSIDLETLCPRYCREGSTRGQLNLFVNIWYESRLLALLHVEITVIDVDDNPPQFPVTIPRPYVLQFKEVIYRTGQQIEVPKAVDLDVQPDHAEIAYRLKAHPEDQSHALDVFKLLTRNDSRLMLVLQQDLDYEAVRLYRFYLVAYSPRLDDRGRKHYISPPQPNFKDQLEIRVEVMNINDIEPVFPQAVYNVELPEDTSVGTVIYTMKAIDRDENATIVYSMESGLNQNMDDMLGVESDGRVILVQSLDYEQQTKYAITVRASDGEFYALTRLEVTVIDVNDELPEFVTNPPALTIEENQPGQTSVGQLFIKDRDSPEVNGQVLCHEPEHLVSRQPLLFYPEINRQFGGSSRSAHSDFNSNNGAILTPSRSSETQVYQQFSLLTRIRFDREVDPHVYESLLICTDGQSSDDSSELKMKRLTTTLTISLTVTDQNDNLPVFEKQHYEAELPENCPIGTKVIQVHANDADRETHARPQYRLLSNDLFPLHFDVEPQTGWIVTKADIDREAQAVYQLTVLAIDGHPTNFDTHMQTGTSAQYAAIRQNTATAHVQLKISDENDNAPEFRGPRQFAVEENQPGPKWIGDLQVMDRDEGVNREVEFILPTEHAAGLIALDANGSRTTRNQTYLHPSSLPIFLAKNGSLYTTKKLDRENQSHVCFEVVVRDKSTTKSLSSTDTICVRVLDLNDNAPQFIDIKGSSKGSNVSQNHKGISDLPNPTVPVSVNEVPGYCALIAEAHDADEGRNALLRFALKPAKSTNNSQAQIGVPDPTDAFMMDQHSGRLMLTRNLNIEEMGLYPLTISVEDSGTPKYRTEKVVYILIEDSPARGNWLFPDTERTQSTLFSGKGDTSEAYTILVVIGLSGISAFLAAVLISAILCMIKPCRNANRRNSDRVHKSVITASTVPGTRYSMNHGDTYISQADGYDDYNMSLMNGNGYIGTIDGRNHPRSLLLTTAPIPGLDQLYLPSDKLIGVDSEVPAAQSLPEDPGWPSQSNNSTMLSSPFMGRLSPTLPLCHYTLAQPLDSTWIAAPNHRAVWSPVSSPNYSTSCNDYQNVCEPDTTSSPQPQIQTSLGTPFGTSHVTATNLSINQPTGINNSAYVNAGLIASPHRPVSSSSYAYRTINTAFGATTNANGTAHGDRNGSGEEQRSDSGRGASDEEVPNARATPTNQGARHSTVSNRQFRSATLKSFHENSSHMIPGLAFPSLPRKSPGSPPTNDIKRLTTFETESPMKKQMGAML